jgi:hypothetical protein
MRTTSTSFSPSSSSSPSSSILLRRHRNRCRLRCKSDENNNNNNNNNNAKLKMKTTTAFFLLPLHRRRQNEDTRARRKRRSTLASSSSSSSSSSKREEDEMMMQSDWLDSSQELDLFNADEERRRRRRRGRAKMKSDESFFLTAEEEERIDFLSITSEEISKARAFVEPEMKRGFAKNIFESATEMREMLEESNGEGEDVFSSSAGGVRAAANDDDNEEENRRRRRQQRRRREEEERSLRRSDLPFVLKQVFKAFSYVTNAIVSALESVVPYQIPLAAIRWSVYGVWVLLAVSSAQRFLVLLACTGGVLLLFGALNAGLNGNFSGDRYGGRSDDGGNRRRRQRSAANTKRRDFDANRRAYTRGSQYRTRSNPRWGKGDNRNASSTMNDELMDLEIPFTDFVSENLNRAAQFGGDALRDLGLSFDEENYSRARKPSSEKSATTLTSTNSRKIGKDEDDGGGDFIDVTLEKQTQDSSSFTVGYREWLEESGAKNGSGSGNSGSSSSSSSTKDIKDETSGDGIKTEFIFNREEDKEREEKVAYEADTISYAAADDDVEGYDDDEIFFDYADYEDERNNFNSSTYGGRFDRESNDDDAFNEDDFIEPIVRRLRQTAGRSFNWFNEFLTGRFYGAFQEDRVEAYAPTPEAEEQELNGGEKQQRDSRRGKEEVGEENAYERGRGGSATR